MYLNNVHTFQSEIGGVFWSPALTGRHCIRLRDFVRWLIPVPIIKVPDIIIRSTYRGANYVYTWMFIAI